MGAPLTIEQMILNHNVGVKIDDASTFDGHPITDFLMKGATFDASAITTGVFPSSRLPMATTNASGVVTLSNNVSSNSNLTAATSSAVYAVKQEADGKANISHTHNPSDINAGTFTNVLTAKSSLSLNAGIIRNIFISDQPPANNVGSDGDIYFQYQP